MRRYGALGELPAAVYPRPEDRRASRPPARATGVDMVPVVRRTNVLPISFLATTSSQEVAASNNNRVWLYIENHGSVFIYVNFGAAANSKFVRIAPNDWFEPGVVPVNSIHIIAASGTAQGILLDGSGVVD